LCLRCSDALPHGRSPFSFVKLAAERWIATLENAAEKEPAMLQLRAFLYKLNTDMTAHALGEGKPPRVFLGMSYFLGQLVAADPLKAQQFFKMAARKGHTGAQYMLAKYFPE
jgi:TPR repeat protein